MYTIPTEHEALEGYANDVKAREDEARELLAQHTELWGDGPPYFSVATHPFWKALAEGKFHLGKCGNCGHVYFPPRVICPQCWAQDAVQLQDTPGVGTLVTFTDLYVTSPALKSLAPLRLAVVDLDEGVRVLTWLRGDGAKEAEPGRRCRIVVEEVLSRKWFIANPI